MLLEKWRSSCLQTTQQVEANFLASAGAFGARFDRAGHRTADCTSSYATLHVH
jgi:hypothetical protein